MKISKHVIILIFLLLFLISSGTLFFVQSVPPTFEQQLSQAVSLIFVLMFVAISWKLLQSRQALNRAKQNLDEAQQLAGLGSWERSLVNGNGYWSENHYRLLNLSPRPMAPSKEEFF